jgi:CheY-like chemotaxis protein
MCSGRATVLVVGADAGLWRHIEALLADEYTLEAAADRRAGLARIAAGGIDLVLLALPPSLEGLSLCYQVREQPGRAYLPVLVLTPPLSPPWLQAVVAAGATDHLTTPLDAAGFREQVRVWANSHWRLQRFYRRLLAALDGVPDEAAVDAAAPGRGRRPEPARAAVAVGHAG